MEKDQSYFDTFFRDSVYLLYKNHLYNYLIRRFVIRRQVGSPNEKEWTLELGCGISPLLGSSKQTVHTDLSWQALTHVRRTSENGSAPPAVTCDATKLPFVKGSIQRVICSEVLEHVENDQAAFDEISRILSPGGKLYLTCPVRPELFGFDDSLVGHFRRYESKELIKELSERGFTEFEVRPVLGPAEKHIMNGATRLFVSLFREGKDQKSRSRPRGVRMVAWALFPFYFILNYLLASVVYLQARLVRPEKAVCLFVQCVKRP